MKCRDIADNIFVLIFCAFLMRDEGNFKLRFTAMYFFKLTAIVDMITC